MLRSTTTSATTCCASIFTACHPALATEARVALTLRLIGGLTTEEIARAFLVPEPTVAQRIVRAKRTLAEKRIPFEVPRGPELAQRLSSVLEVIYLIFNEGYSATAGDDWMRPQLCEEALRLGRILAELAPAEPEVHGLVALMEIQASRLGARTGPIGRADPAARPEPRALGSAAHPPRACCACACRARVVSASGPYALQAAIAACHARARSGAGDRLGAHRRALRCARRGPAVAVVELNRAVAHAMAYRSGGGSRPGRQPDRGAVAQGLSSAAERARRSAEPSSAASRRPAQSSSAPPRSRATSASASCCWTAPRRARAIGNHRPGRCRLSRCRARPRRGGR